MWSAATASATPLKMLAAREQDQGDIAFLVETLGIRSAEQGLAIVEQYYSPSRIPAAARYILAGALERFRHAAADAEDDERGACDGGRPPS